MVVYRNVSDIIRWSWISNRSNIWIGWNMSCEHMYIRQPWWIVVLIGCDGGKGGGGGKGDLWLKTFFLVTIITSWADWFFSVTDWFFSHCRLSQKGNVSHLSQYQSCPDKTTERLVDMMWYERNVIWERIFFIFKMDVKNCFKLNIFMKPVHKYNCYGLKYVEIG